MDTHMLLDIYLRLSDLRYSDLDHQGNAKTLVFEEGRLRERLKQIGARLGEVIIENDIVDGKPKPASAFKKKTVVLADGSVRKRVVRPEWKRLLQRMEKGLSGGFITVDLDRAVRDLRDLEDLIEVVEATKANVRTLSGTLNFTNGIEDGEREKTQMFTIMAQKASRDTSRRVTASRLRKARNGEYGGGKRPFGFEKDGITPIEAEIEEIRKASKLVLAGASLRSLVQDLRTRGVPTVQGGAWNTSSLKDILIRPRNAGIMIYKGEPLPNPAPWKAIVSKDELRTIESKLTKHKASAGRAPRWLGSGIFLCSCGYKLAVHTSSTRPSTYRCKENIIKGKQHTSRKVADVDDYVTDLIVDWCAQPVAIKRLIPPDLPTVDVVALRVEVKTLEEDMRQYAFERASKQITSEVFAIMNKTAMDRLAVIEAELAKAAQESPLIDLVYSAGNSTEIESRRKLVRAAWESFPIGVQRMICKELVMVKLLPRPANLGRKPFESKYVEVDWNY